MRKICYTWSPRRIADNPAYASLSMEEKGVFRSILDAIWLSDNQYKVAYEIDRIADMIGADREVTARVIDKAIAGEKPLLSIELDIDSRSLFLYYNEFSKEIRDFNEVASITQGSPSSSKIGAKISNEEKGIDREKKPLFTYSGFMPTNRYETSGQHFEVTESLRKNLLLVAKNKDIDAELNKIFGWLKKYPEKRKSYSDMEAFLFSWIRRVSDETGSLMDDIDNELDKLLGIEPERKLK